MQTLSRSRLNYAQIDGTIKSVYAPINDWGLTDVAIFHGLIKMMSAQVSISSLPVTEVPALPEFPTADQKFTIARDSTWGQPRFDLQIYLRVAGGAWQPWATCSLQNHAGVPYYSIPLLAYLTDGLALGVAQDTEIGAAIKDAGYGAPTANDKCTIFYEVHEEAILNTRLTACTPRTWSLTSASQTIAAANPSRRRLTLVNAGETPIYAARGPAAYPDRGLLILPGGVLDLDAAYLGPVSAIAPTGSGTLVGEECQ